MVFFFEQGKFIEQVVFFFFFLEQGINEKILSFDYKDYKAEIRTADAQKSYKDGVTVLVTGCLMGKDNLKRKFAQSFFLAPQANGYFVLNDVFRYVEDGELLENHSVNGIDDATAVSLTANPGRVAICCCYFVFPAPVCPTIFLEFCMQGQFMFQIPLHQIQQMFMRMQIKISLRKHMMRQSVREN